MAKRWMVGMTAAALAGLLAGCGGEETSTTGKPKYKVALVMKSLANEFFKTMEQGARAHQQKNEWLYELIVNGLKDESDVNGQINIVDQMIAQRVSAIVIAPADSKALVPICKKAKEAGITVVNIDNQFDEEALREKEFTIPFFGPDNRKAARLAGERLAPKLKRDDKVVIIEGKTNANNGLMRKLGFQQAMDEAGIKVAESMPADWDMKKGEEVASGLLSRHPDIKAILCANDSMAIGAVAALKSAGKLGKIYVVGFDNISAIQEHIKNGNVLCTVDQHADQIAIAGISHALDMLQGRPSVSHEETPVEAISLEQLQRGPLPK
jgi:ribose transport system substrate-binding protein